MLITENNGVRCYNLTGKTKAIKYDKKEAKKNNKINEKSELNIIQGFSFQNYSTNIEISPDNNYICASGMYGPTIKIFSLKESSLKCLRGLDSEVISLSFISEDYKKIAFACFDRNIEIHSQGGRHCKFRIPKVPRHMIFNKYSCDLVIANAGDNIDRINLDEGRFHKPVPLCNTKSSFCIEYLPNLDIYAVGGENGNINVLDFRCNNSNTNIINLSLNDNQDISTIKNNNFFDLYVGSSEGIVRQYDIRYLGYVNQFKNTYFDKINSIEISKNIIIFSDYKSIKVADTITGNQITTVETNIGVNKIKLYPDSGMIFAASEKKDMGIFFIPSIGPAPLFTQYLDTITEELEEKKNEIIFDNFKFVNYTDLEKINATRLIGTNKLKPYLNGFIIDYNLYDNLKNKFEGFDYEKYKEEEITKKIKKKMEDSIYIKSNKIKINNNLIAKINKNNKSIDIINDSRFKNKLFMDENFKIEEGSDAYKQLHPSNKKKIEKNIKDINSESSDINSEDEKYLGINFGA